MIKKAINDILNNENNEINIEECFDEIFSGLSEPVLSGIFLTLLEIKQYGMEDIVSVINSARSAVKKAALTIDSQSLIENICLNGCSKYLDISFAMDVILSANGIGAVKYNPQSGFYQNISFDTFRAFNLNTENLTADNYEKTKFIYNYLSNETPYIKYTQELYRVLPFKTILNTVNYFLNPLSAKNCTIALSDKNLVEKYANLCLNLGYENSIIFSGGNFPYISIEGESKVSEAWKNKIFSYTMTPELLGIERKPLDDVKVENSNHSAEVINAVFENKLKDANFDIIILNSALALYITKCAKSLMEGVELARKTVIEGRAKEQLEMIKKTYCS